MRYGKEHKQETRQRIIETAGRRFKRDGIEGSGIATLMADAGLTNGAFYAHFTSKNDLVASAVADQLGEQRASLSELAPGRPGVEQYVRKYLSIQHRDNPDDGCPSAALLDEIGRCTDATKRAYTDGIALTSPLSHPSERRMTKHQERGGRASPAVGYPSPSTMVQSRAGRPSCTGFCGSAQRSDRPSRF